ncbi:hypothetical protein A9Q83_12615 [Alphaproteobacteria bacterium 46_93_T64]|nr:hypothetical protein A9Q83_12615 [Alphaproteobacteria bacterium 46_93_T64]
MKYLLPFLFLALSSPAMAEIYPGPFKAEVYYVNDGDTFFARVKLWPGLNTDVNIRLRGVDTPETWRPECESEKTAGKTATQFIMDLFGSPHRGAILDKPMAVVELRNVKLGKYAGRVLADVFYKNADVAKGIIDAGLGRAYTGGKRHGWCD